MRDIGLSEDQRRFALSQRRGVLATARPNGAPRVVPICFAIDAYAIVSVIDDKPKAGADPHRLGRVRDIAVHPDVSVLVDRWDEDWTRLAWLRIDGVARLVEPGEQGHERAVAALRERYAAYRPMKLDRAPVISVRPIRVVAWGDLRV
ncbi:MAG: TIGR03668 family PPOX class F420-dependent oxidoreductase [Candidatus Limnocylindria bacterium]